MTMTGTEDYELERLRAEVQQERQMKDMLEQSVVELQVTVDELEKRIDNVDGESNEWKTRYETQVEMNQQLDKQIISLSGKVEDAKRTIKDSKMPKSMRTENPDEVTPYYVKKLEKDKNSFESQLRDMEWRWDQESKAYHKANEERKQYMTEIQAAKGTIDHTLKHKGHATHRSEADTPNLTVTPRQVVGNSNIPQDQRILDPRHGPIKKTAAVKNLPRID